MNLSYISLFSGIGAFEKSLDRLEIPYELVGFSEIDKYAVKSYCAIHGVDEQKNLGDITKIDEKALPKGIDLITYGFPCQDISISGKMRGLFNEDGSQTRSGLFFEALRIIEATQPKVAIAENVKNLTGKKFKEQFKIVLESLEQAGYNNYWQVLNSKDYGIPQNRERVFIVSIRKDIDSAFFKFPEGFPLELRLKDVLDDEVDEQFYLSNVQIDKLHIKSKDALVYDKSMIGFEGNAREYNDIMPTITSREWKEPRVVNENRLNEIHMLGLLDIKGNEQVRRVYGTDGIAPTLNTMQGGNRQPKVLVEPTINKIDIPQTVKVRKYPVDTERLCEVLRHHKALADLNNNGISNALGVPTTTVAHWFRKDEYFAIPEPDIWPRLKSLLGIETDEFDEAIMTFEEKEGVFEKSERHYFSDGLAPTLTSTSAGNEKIITAVAMRGRYNEDGKVEQNIELSDREYANALTTVQKDSMIGVQKLFDIPKEVLNDNERQRRVYSDDGASPTLLNRSDSPKILDYQLRIRKLTPKECFRLMDFEDSDFAKAEAVNSNTQLYKQAGNSIVVAVAYYIIKALIEAKIFTERENKEMELRVNEVQLPEQIAFNYEELKAELTSKVSMYETMVYTDEQIKSAKEDRANLNKLKKALNDERIRREKEYMQPFNDFKAKINEIIGIIDKPVAVIDKQVKEFEEKQKQDKLKAIKDYWGEQMKPIWLMFNQIYDEKWLNASVSMKSVQEAINSKIEQVKNDLDTLSNLPEFSFEATEVYKSTLDVNKAINEGHRLSEIAKKKAEYEAEAKARAEELARLEAAAERQIQTAQVSTNINDPNDIENVVPIKPVEEAPAKQWISFSALLSTEDALALRDFFNSRKIEFKAI